MRDAAIVYLAFLLYDVVAAVHIRALVNGPMPTAIATVAVMQVLSLLPIAWLADKKELRQRIGLALAAASGAATGTAIVMTWGL